MLERSVVSRYALLAAPVALGLFLAAAQHREAKGAAWSTRRRKIALVLLILGVLGYAGVMLVALAGP